MSQAVLAEALAAHRSGDIARAQALLEAALRVTPDAPDLRYCLARAQWDGGLPEDARKNAQRCRSVAPGFAPASLLLAIIESAAGNAPGARQALADGGATDIANFRVRDAVVQMAAAEAVQGRAAFSRWAAAPAPAPPLSFTVVTCSIDAEKLARAQASVRRSDRTEVQWTIVRNARSLAGAYNEALDRTTSDAVLFMHDDVEVVTPGLFAALSRALATADVAGVAATRRLAGPTLGWSGQEHACGALAHGSSVAGHYDYSLLNWIDAIETCMQGLDGCFMAARTEFARRLRFDEETFDGFHFYDLDFAYRASRQARVAVTAEVLIAHASRGSVGGAWEAQSRRFLAKFPELAECPVRPSHFYAARFATTDQLLAMHREMRGLAAVLGREG